MLLETFLIFLFSCAVVYPIYRFVKWYNGGCKYPPAAIELSDRRKTAPKPVADQKSHDIDETNRIYQEKLKE